MNSVQTPNTTQQGKTLSTTLPAHAHAAACFELRIELLLLSFKIIFDSLQLKLG